MTIDQIDYLRNHNIQGLSNVEAVILKLLVDAVDANHILTVDMIYAIASTRYYKNERESYVLAMTCLKHFGLVQPFRDSKLPDDGIDDFYQVTPAGRDALAALLAV